MSQLSPERIKFLEHLDNFIAGLKPGCLVYEIGKSHLHDYKPLFEKFRHKTIDIDPAKKPDLLFNVESDIDCIRAGCADAIIMHGVFEQCTDPCKLIRGAKSLLKPKGKALFGLISVGFPLFEFDRMRITPNGVEHYLQGFTIKNQEIVHRGELPSYVFIHAERL